MLRRALTLALSGLALLPSPVGASSLLFDGSGRWVHQHSRSYTYRFDPGVPSHVRTGVRAAARQWSDRTVLTLTETSGAASITAVMRQLDSPFIGFAWVPFHAPATIAFDPDWARYSYFRELRGSYEALPCHELGHALGLDHGGSGCLNGSPAPSYLDQSKRYPGADDVALINRQYVATGH